jgi:hypothetical protein
MKLSSVELGVIRLFALIEKTRITRYVYVWIAIFWTGKTLMWSFDYAAINAARPGIDVAAVIAAVSAVPGALAAFAFKDYNASSRQ